MKKPLYLNDLSRCRPRAALSPAEKRGCWRLLPYETTGTPSRHGVMVGVASFVDAPPITLPLNVAGWHAIHIGFWNPHWVYDGGTLVKVKLDNDPCFFRIAEPEGPVEYGGTFLKEAFFKAADLSGRKLVIAKTNGPFAQKAYVAYVKLAPLGKREARVLQHGQAQAARRPLQACIDGMTYFWMDECRTKEHLLELVERYRQSDVGKVIWAVNYGELTNYPSRAGIFLGRQANVPIRFAPAKNSYLHGAKASSESLNEMFARGIIPQDVIAKHVHAMGLKFEFMFRLGILGPIPPMRELKGAAYFVRKHPEFRQVLKNGLPIEKASYAFPEVRQFMLAIIREAAERFDLDGVHLGFVRGPHFMQYEKPVLADFRQEFGEDGLEVSFRDPRMIKVRCRHLTDFVKETRQLLDEIGKHKGKRLELGVWVEKDHEVNLEYAQDVIAWVKAGLIDSVTTINGLSHALLAAAQVYCRKYILSVWPNQPREQFVEETLQGLAAKVDGLAIWDLDQFQDSPEWWRMVRWMGHRRKMEGLRGDRWRLPGIRLKTLAGYDVLDGLTPAVYSGG